MQKIMFNDRFGLTKAVLNGRKTQTRRLVPEEVFTLQHDFRDENVIVIEDDFGDFIDIRKTKYARYKVGEVVAVAQRYHDANVIGDTTLDYAFVFDEDDAGYNNKMFVKSELMPHQIRITNVWMERLMEITNDDCMREGIRFYSNIDECNMHGGYGFLDKKGTKHISTTPVAAYANLINRINGKGTWESNPWVFAYEFELVK